MILDLGLVGETELLKALATHYKVYFVSSEKLSKADVARAVVDMIPQRFAEKLGMCPLMFDAKTLALSVVTSDPEDVEALREAQLASGAREVKGVYARPAAVRALIAKAYLGDIHAFALLDRQAHAQMHMRVYGGNDIALDDGSPPPPPPRVEAKREPPPLPPSSRQAPAAGARAAGAERARDVRGFAGAGRTQKVSDASFVELLHVLVSLLESTRADLRGHSAEVARLVRRLGDNSGSRARARRCSSSRPSSTTSARWASFT